MNRFRIDRGEQHVSGLQAKGRQHRRGRKPVRDFNPRDYARFSINIPTPDDFCPTLEDGTVEVTVMLLHKLHPDEKPLLRTCAWGGDDLGLERDEEFDTPQEAQDAFLRRIREVSGWGIVTFRMLQDLGFKWA